MPSAFMELRKIIESGVSWSRPVVQLSHDVRSLEVYVSLPSIPHTCCTLWMELYPFQA